MGGGKNPEKKTVDLNFRKEIILDKYEKAKRRKWNEKYVYLFVSKDGNNGENNTVFLI